MRSLVLALGLLVLSSAAFAQQASASLNSFMSQVETQNVTCVDQMKNNLAVSFKIIAGNRGVQVDNQNIYTVTLPGVSTQDSPLVVYNTYRGTTLNPISDGYQAGDRIKTLEYYPSTAPGTANIFTVNEVQVVLDAEQNASYNTLFNYQCSF